MVKTAHCYWQTVYHVIYDRLPIRTLTMTPDEMMIQFAPNFQLFDEPVNGFIGYMLAREDAATWPLERIAPQAG